YISASVVLAGVVLAVPVQMAGVTSGTIEVTSRAPDNSRLTVKQYFWRDHFASIPVHSGQELFQQVCFKHGVIINEENGIAILRQCCTNALIVSFSGARVGRAFDDLDAVVSITP